MGKVVMITSGKGGTGKTTICAGLASCLAAMDKKVLAIDCDIGLSNLDIALGMQDCATISFLDVMMENHELDDAAEHPTIPGLQLLVAPPRIQTGLIDDEVFGRLIAEAKETYDWVLLDSPAGVGEGFHLAAANADQAFVVTMADPGSQRDGQNTVILLREHNISEMQLIVNRVSRRLLRSVRANIDDIMDRVGLPLLGIVPEDPAVPAAASADTALILRSRKGAALACLHISRRMLGFEAPLVRVP